MGIWPNNDSLKGFFSPFDFTFLINLFDYQLTGMMSDNGFMKCLYIPTNFEHLSPLIPIYESIFFSIMANIKSVLS